MKINSVPPSDAISSYVNAVKRSAVQGPQGSGTSDSVELSEGARTFSALMKAARQAMEETGAQEEARAADIMERVQAGTYQVSSWDVASSILGGSRAGEE